jgi:U3 small nucleolar RNA-associated protein 23
MRHLYAASSEPGVSFVIDKAKMFERRRCGHLPDDYPEPLSARDCIKSVVDGKGNGTNKHRYVVASQDLEVRKSMRAVQGVPLVYINRSVMIMEPMAGTSAEVREREEKSKFRQGIKSGRASGSLKRKREDGGEEEEEASAMKDMGSEDGAAKKKKKAHGPKGPNPLAVKKSKKRVGEAGGKADDTGKVSQDRNTGENTGAGGAEPAKRKRKRLHSKKKPGNGEVGGTQAEAATSAIDEAD